jgi:C4-dicarboxylate transporter, DctM subunit
MIDRVTPAACRVHPAHLGIIFIANLELGYLTPPVGLNR